MLDINNCATLILIETSNHVVHYLTTLANFCQRQWGTTIAFYPPNIACSLSHVAFHTYHSITPFCKCPWVGVLSLVMSYVAGEKIQTVIFCRQFQNCYYLMLHTLWVGLPIFIHPEFLLVFRFQVQSECRIRQWKIKRVTCQQRFAGVNTKYCLNVIWPRVDNDIKPD